MRPEIEAALDSLQAWADANPEHLAEIIGTRHAVTETGQQATDSRLNYPAAQLVAERFHHITKPEAEHRQEIDSVLIAVSPTRTGMPPLWVLVSNRPVLMPELVMALSEKRREEGK